MSTAFYGICLSVTMAITLISLLSGSRNWFGFLVVVGLCAIFGGIGWAMVGGLMATLGDSVNGGAAIKQQGQAVIALGLVGVVAGAIGVSKQTPSDG